MREGWTLSDPSGRLSVEQRCGYVRVVEEGRRTDMGMGRHRCRRYSSEMKRG